MTAAMDEYSENPFEPPTEWDHIPTLSELSQWMSFAPGVDYCWVLVKNMPQARKHGWSYVRLATAEGPVGQMSVMKVKDTDVILLCQGKQIPGIAAGTVPVEFRMDPELLDLVKSWTPAPAPAADALPPPPSPNAVGAPGEAPKQKGYTPPSGKR